MPESPKRLVNQYISISTYNILFGHFDKVTNGKYKSSHSLNLKISHF